MKLGLLVAAMTLGLALLAPAGASAQNYPERAIRLVIPFGPGSGTDSIGRALAKAITEDTGQPVIIDNKPGGNAFIGVQTVQKAAPDGYTVLLSGSSSQVLNMLLFKQVPYDPIKDFVPVTPVARTSMIMNVNAKSHYRTLADVIGAARASPSRLSVGSGSSTTHLVGEFFQQRSGVKLLHVPYKTPALAITDLLGEQVDIVFVDLPASGPHIRAGTLRALAVTGNKRMQGLPDVPTLQELGVKEFDMTAWYGFWLPAGTPQPIAAKLHDIVERAMKTAAVRAFFDSASMETFTMTPAEFSKFHRSELEKTRQVVTDARIEPQ